LGRLVLERRGTVSNLQALLLGLSVSLPLVGIAWAKHFGVPLAGLLAGGTAWYGLGLVWLLRTFVCTVRCHEFGLCFVQLARRHEVGYEDIAGFGFRTKRVLLHGGTSRIDVRLDFSFVPRRNLKPRTVYFTSWLQDAAVQAIVKRVVDVVADGLAGDLASDRGVRWTPRITLYTDRLELSGRSTPLYFGAIDRWEIVRGVFCLLEKGRGRPVIRESTYGPNFFPGLRLFQDLMHQAGAVMVEPASNCAPSETQIACYEQLGLLAIPASPKMEA
jgi:hypothetical protein